MNLKEFKKTILKNISKKKFYISDGNEIINGNEIKIIIDRSIDLSPYGYHKSFLCDYSIFKNIPSF